MRLNPAFHQSARSRQGFTAIELLIVVAILAVLTSLALPSFTGLIERIRIIQISNEMRDTLYYARSEAIRRGGGVTIQKNPQNFEGCTLAATNPDWGCGWVVSADGQTLRMIQPPKNTLVTFGGSGATLALDRYGMAGLNAFRFTFAPERLGTASPATRSLCVGSGGQIRFQEGAACS